ncbi:hypothetical protein SAMN05444157_3675 [Frankineae bacterium MT45]|nr:hypothetical protein SAMN05444157_3675 [Frankineae bacterium MT45]
MRRKRMLKVVLATTVLLVGMIAVPTAAQADPPGQCPYPVLTRDYPATSRGIAGPGPVTLGRSTDGTPPGTTDTHYCEYRISYNGQSVDVFWGFDYGLHTSGNLRGFVYMEPTASNIHLQVDPLNLGTYNGVLTSTSLNVQSGNLFAETPPVNPCHTLPGAVYISNAHITIRFSDGTLVGGGPQYADNGSTICS